MLAGIDVHIGLDHLVIEVVAFAGAFTHAGQNRITAVSLGDVVDQFLHGHGLAHARAAEQADLAALGVGAEQVDDLDPGHQNFGRGGLFGEGRSFPVDRAGEGGGDRTRFVDRVADHVHDAAQGGRAHRNGNAGAGVDHVLTTG